jgi:hypothetical protein
LGDEIPKAQKTIAASNKKGDSQPMTQLGEQLLQKLTDAMAKRAAAVATAKQADETSATTRTTLSSSSKGKIEADRRAACA